MVWNGRRFFHIPYWQFSSIPFPFHTKNLPFRIPFHTKILVEAGHANAHARAIAFFSYIWFKYDILSLQCCKLGGEVDSTLSSRPLRTRVRYADRLCIPNTVCRNLEGDVRSYLFLLQNLALELGLGQRCRPEGIAIT